MTPKSDKYSEEALVEDRLWKLFSRLGWSVRRMLPEFDENGLSFLGRARRQKEIVVLISRLKPILQKINFDLPEVAIDEAIKVLMQDRSVMGMASANREVFTMPS
jgi:hypothetical protein